MTERVTGSASVTIGRPADEVFAAIADVTRMGEWSPETTGCRWADGAGPALRASFEGDNVAALGPITLKKWTTTSTVTGFDPPRTFEFVTEETTTWRFDFLESDGSTTITESFSYPQYGGIQKILYNLVGSRQKAMTRGAAQTLHRLKSVLEG